MARKPPLTTRTRSPWRQFGAALWCTVRATRSYNIVVRLDNGKTRTVHQSAAPNWRQGDRVRVVNGGLRAMG